MFILFDFVLIYRNSNIVRYFKELVVPTFVDVLFGDIAAPVRFYKPFYTFLPVVPVLFGPIVGMTNNKPCSYLYAMGLKPRFLLTIPFISQLKLTAIDITAFKSKEKIYCSWLKPSETGIRDSDRTHWHRRNTIREN